MRDKVAVKGSAWSVSGCQELQTHCGADFYRILEIAARAIPTFGPHISVIAVGWRNASHATFAKKTFRS